VGGLRPATSRHSDFLRVVIPRLSIIIVSYNAWKPLEECLRSLARHPPVVTHEIVVVDNASSDNTAALVRQRWPAVLIIEAGGNVGFAKANNIAIRQTRGELILLLNPDTLVPPGSLDRLVRVLDSRPDVAVAGPRVINPDGRAELSFGSMISPLTELHHRILVKGNDRGIGALAHYVERLTRREREVDWVSGACLMARRQDTEAAGLIDERYFMYFEDVDFCAAVRAQGRRVLFTPAAEIVHLRGQSRVGAAQATARAYRSSQVAFYQRHHPLLVPFLRAYLKLKGELPDTSIKP
jgi:hypothetical protein